MESIVMNDLSNSIVSELEKVPNQTASELSKKLNIDKALLNSCLYGQLTGKVVQDSNYRWSLSSARFRADAAQQHAGYKNTNLARLCRYYLACLGQEEVGISTFAWDKYGNEDYVELSKLPHTSNDLTQLSEIQPLLNKIKQDRGNQIAYLGYPTSLKLIKSKKSNWQGFVVEPILLFPIELNTEDRSPYLDLSYPIINYKAFQAFTNAERELILDELAQLESELGLGATNEPIEIDELALRLQAIRAEWPWLEAITPEQLNYQPNVKISSLKNGGIYNKAVIIKAERSPFTAGLETELKMLGQLEPELYSQTALGHWLKSLIPEVSTDESLNIIDVLPMNLEQRAAVRSSISKPLTIITGPPGTGKSQVVTNILVNAAWQGKKVLFASKNNKAVDVVETRVNALGPRPVLMRVGSNQYQMKLAEYVMGIMSSVSSNEDVDEFEFCLNKNTELQEKLSYINASLSELINLRNEVDRLEQKIEPVREQFRKDVFNIIHTIDVARLMDNLGVFIYSLNQCIKEKNSFFGRLFWFNVLNIKIDSALASKQKVSQQLSKLFFDEPFDQITESNAPQWIDWVEGIIEKLNSARAIIDYKLKLKELQSAKSIESLSEEKIQTLKSISSNAEVMWSYWLKIQPSRLTHEQRSMLNRYTSVLKMVIDNIQGQKLPGNIYKKYAELFAKVAHLLTTWAVTSLSAKGKLPFDPGYFDLVVFDEASQCDIASALPLLYRAKAAVVIGDPKQLSHISTLKRGYDQQLLDKYDLIDEFPHWSYSNNSLFDLASGLVNGNDVIHLLDHHRSHADIIEYSNKEFYEGRLRVATNYDRLKRRTSGDSGIRWINVKGETKRPVTGGAINIAEVNAVCAEIEDLVLHKGYEGTIGVVCPFRAQANAIRERISLHDHLFKCLDKAELLVDTAHRFQGDERDIIIFSPTISNGAQPATLSFLSNNKNLFNVAITRARAQLIVVGDQQYCSDCGIEYFQKFVKYYNGLKLKTTEPISHDAIDLGPEYPIVAKPEQVSEWEHLFYKAMYHRGIRAIPQYDIEKYSLDFAVFAGKKKLNIEIDGERYHKNWTGELCRRDQLRNQRMFELGWDVKRFWVYEVRDEIDTCLDYIESWIKRHV